MKKTIIKPTNGWVSIDFRELLHSVDLFIILVTKEIKIRYKQTAIGILWVILQPLLTVLLFTFIFGRLVALPSNGFPYLIFAFAGMLPWFLFSQAVLRASNSLIGEARLISKVYFPRILLPVASCASVLVDFLVCLIVMLGLLAFYQIPLTWNFLCIVPATILVMAFSIGVSAWTSSLNVYYRDIGYAIPFLMQIWMYVSPLLYPCSLVPDRWLFLYNLNPLVGIIELFRWALLDISSFPWTSLSISLIATPLILFGGLLLFRRIERSFSDVI